MIFLATRRSTYERCTVVTISNIESATAVVEEFLRRQKTIQTNGELIAHIVFQLTDEVSPTLVAAALEQLSQDNRVELTKTRGVYDSVTYIWDETAELTPTKKESPMKQPKAGSVISAEEVKQAYDALFDAAGLDGELFITSCAQFISEQLTVPKWRAHTINGLLAKIDLRESTRLGGGRMRHTLLAYKDRVSLDEISERLEKCRADERARQAAKRSEPLPDQLELQSDGPKDVPDSASDAVAATDFSKDTDQVVGEPNVAPEQFTPEPPVDPQLDQAARQRLDSPLTLAPQALDGFEAAVLYQLLSLYETTNGANLTQLSNKIREHLPVRVRTWLAHLLVEMVRPE